jgi:hypothetical protein
MSVLITASPMEFRVIGHTRATSGLGIGAGPNSDFAASVTDT